MPDQPFDDQDLPLAPDDDLPKPDDGAWLIFKDQSSLSDMPPGGEVVRTYDSLAEDWGNDGENSWSQRDTNELAGHKGRWYAICEVPNDPLMGSWSVASYEVQEIH